MEKNNFKISGLTCGACQKVTQKLLMKIEGVEEVKVELSGDTLVVASRKISLDEAKKALEGTHYTIYE